MRMKQALILVLPLAFLVSPYLMAEPRKNTERPGWDTRKDANDVHIIIRKEADRKQRQAQDNADHGTQQDGRADDNSNRQSEPNSLTGLERAQARRAEQAENHTQAGGKDDAGWYEYLFGQKQAAGEESERDWYGYLFGKPKAKQDGSRQDKDTQEDGNERSDSRWWPFD